MRRYLDKGLITDDWAGGYLKAKLGWLTPSGIALSFGLQGFLAGVATQVLAQHLAKPLAATPAKAEAALAMLDSAEGASTPSTTASSWAYPTPHAACTGWCSACARAPMTQPSSTASKSATGWHRAKR